MSVEQTDVMKGALSDFDLSNVLQVVSIGRQFIGVELERPNAAPATVYTKGGQVLDAHAGNKRGVEAFNTLFEVDFDTFRVFRMPTPERWPRPIGRLHELLARVPAGRAAKVKKTSRTVERVVASPAKSSPRVSPSANGRQAKGPSANAPSAQAPSVEAPPREDTKPGAPIPRATPTRPEGTSRQPQPTGVTPIVAVSSSKGGVGKTTIALHLAFTFARRGLRTILVDADPNGDVLSYVNARDRAQAGAYDIMLHGNELQSALISTNLDKLQILPASGPTPPRPSELHTDLTSRWRLLFDALVPDVDIVVVDTPAGTYGPAHSVLRASSHVMGVLQAEAIAQRSFEVFRRSVEMLDEEVRPHVVGVLLNMLQSREDASVAVLQHACADLPHEWLFDAAIPRTAAFLHASHVGVPLLYMDEDNPPPAAWLFDNLASELLERVGLGVARTTPVRRLV